MTKGAQPLTSLPLSQIKTGDLIFRAGKGWRADAVRLASDQNLTHVGIVDRDPGGDIFVVHSDAPNALDNGGVRRVSLHAFSDPSLASSVVVYRLPYSDTVVRNMAINARGFAHEKTSFDDAFSLRDPTKLYCTELIWRSLVEAGQDMKLKTSEIGFSGLNERILMPVDLLQMTGATALPSLSSQDPRAAY